MLNTIFAKKIGMAAKYNAAGKRMGATVVSVPTMKISGVRTMDKHGYEAIQIEAANHKNEVRTNEADLLSLPVGQEIVWNDIIKEGDKVWVSGISKGHGFTGVVRHYGFKGGPRTHGQSDRERSRGSSGATTTPGRVFKGKRMAGRYGNEKTTVKNLKVLQISLDERQIVLSGPIPGKKTGMIIITKHD